MSVQRWRHQQPALVILPQMYTHYLRSKIAFPRQLRLAAPRCFLEQALNALPQMTFPKHSQACEQKVPALPTVSRYWLLAALAVKLHPPFLACAQHKLQTALPQMVGSRHAQKMEQCLKIG